MCIHTATIRVPNSKEALAQFDIRWLNGDAGCALGAGLGPRELEAALVATWPRDVRNNTKNAIYALKKSYSPRCFTTKPKHELEKRKQLDVAIARPLSSAYDYINPNPIITAQY